MKMMLMVITMMNKVLHLLRPCSWGDCFDNGDDDEDENSNKEYDGDNNAMKKPPQGVQLGDA